MRIGSKPAWSAAIAAVAHVAFATTIARAQPGATDDPNAPPPPDDPSTPAVDPDDPMVHAARLRHFAVNANPFSLLVGRLSADFQWLPRKHHALVLNGFVFFIDPATAPMLGYQDEGQGAFGSEVAYRYYSQDRGANGLFAGGGAVVGHTPSGRQGARTYFGPVLDIGVQGIMDSGFMLGIGIGAQWRIFPTGGSAVLMPRILGTVGYAF